MNNGLQIHKTVDDYSSTMLEFQADEDGLMTETKYQEPNLGLKITIPVVFSPGEAKKLYAWLGERIKEFNCHDDE